MIYVNLIAFFKTIKYIFRFYTYRFTVLTSARQNCDKPSVSVIDGTTAESGHRIGIKKQHFRIKIGYIVACRLNRTDRCVRRGCDSAGQERGFCRDREGKGRGDHRRLRLCVRLRSGAEISDLRAGSLDLSGLYPAAEFCG